MLKNVHFGANKCFLRKAVLKKLARKPKVDYLPFSKVENFSPISLAVKHIYFYVAFSHILLPIYVSMTLRTHNHDLIEIFTSNVKT